MIKPKKLPQTAAIIILTILALLQLLYIILSLRPKEKTDFDKYPETQSLPLYSTGLESFSFSVPKQWADSWTGSGELSEDMKNYYLNTDGSSEYSYEDKIICVRSDNSIQIVKRGEFYVNLAVADLPYQGIIDTKIFSSEYLASLGLDTEGIEICEFCGGTQPGGYVPDYSVYSIIFILLLKMVLW